MLRETKEETGLVLDDTALAEPAYRFKSARPVPDGFIFEENVVFKIVLPETFSPKGEDDEVEAFLSMTPADIINAIEAGRFMPEAAHVFLTAVEND